MGTDRRQGYVKMGGRNWKDATISQGMLAVTRSWKKQGADYSLELLTGEYSSADNFDFSPVTLISND